nr:DUF1906 domain-containing protein [Streptomyces luteogriseus]
MPAILEYFRGVASGLGSKGKRYVHGVYGSVITTRATAVSPGSGTT